MTAPLRLALFDCDGTLVDSQHAIQLAMAEAWRAHGLPAPDPARVRRIVGLSLPHAMQALLPDHGAEDHAILAGLYRQAFHDHRLAGRHDDPLYPGAVAALDALEAAGFVLGIATGKGRNGLLGILERHGLSDRFVTLQTADRCRGKPDPEMVERALAETGAEASATVVIGDTVYDMAMARAAGAFGIGVGWGYHPAGELRAAGAHRLVDAYPELPDAVAELVG